MDRAEEIDYALGAVYLFTMLETIGALAVTAGLALLVVFLTFGLISMALDRFTKGDGLDNTITAGLVAAGLGLVTLAYGLFFVAGLGFHR